MLTLITTIFFSCLIILILFFNKLSFNISTELNIKNVTNLIKGIVIILLCMIISQYYNMTIHEEQLNALKNKITELERTKE